MLHLIGQAIFGLIVGVIAKFLMPGRDPGGFIVTALIGLVGVLCILILSLIPRYDYFFSRIDTFLNPAAQNSQTSGYQIRQSLIAVGSGGFAGRGLGQGIQKFTYLPEPMGDSIFAVVAEELGFIGGSITILLFLILGLKGYGIAARAPDLFS